MRVNYRKILLLAALFWVYTVCPVQASFVTIDAFSLTIPAYTFNGSLSLPKMNRNQGLTLMPFYLQLNFSGNQNMNWGIELYSDNRQRLTSTANATPDGLYRGLRGYTTPAEKIPLYWQVYPTDLGVISTWSTPQSVTVVAGGLGFYDNTLRYWGTVYDRSDVDRIPTWDAERNDRVVASVSGLGTYPLPGRLIQGTNAFLYFAADLRGVLSTQDFVGQMVMDFFHYPFDFNKGCYVTPNPVKPVLGQRAYFNFYTNSPDSKIRIKIYDPTGYPIVTLDNTRYWDCRNSNGHWVEGGLYLYQIEVEGHFISGTMVVIK
jgi:hypothetical protein